MVKMNRKAAMEMSVGTIVTIVLLVTVLVLGLVLVRTVFDTGTDAVDQIDTAVQNEINKLFADEGNLVVYPASRELTLERGEDPKGFAFSVKNNEETSDATFSYSLTTTEDDVSRCGEGFTKNDAENMLIAGTGEFSLGPGAKLDIPRLIRFDVPETAPLCTIVYNLEIQKEGSAYSTAQIFVTIE